MSITPKMLYSVSNTYNFYRNYVIRKLLNGEIIQLTDFKCYQNLLTKYIYLVAFLFFISQKPVTPINNNNKIELIEAI